MRNRSRRDLTQVRLKFAVRQLDRIKIRRVFRKIPHARVCLLNRFPNGRSHVNSAVIHHHDVVASEGWDQALLNIGEEHFSGHSSLDYHRGSHFIVAQGRHESDRLPCPQRNGADHPDTPWRTPPEPHQICADRSLVDKNEPGAIKKTLLSYPTSACSRDVLPLPRSVACRPFFKGDVVTVEKTPERAAGWFEFAACAALQASLPASGPDAQQSQPKSRSRTLRVAKRFRRAASQRRCYRPASAAAT